MNRPGFSRPAPAPRPATVDYPDSDGQPVAETDFQRIPLWYANDVLARHFRDRDDIYVSANMFVYFEEGNPKAVVAPDVFVVLGAPDHKRRSYKVWEEPKGPDFVLEITSHSTRSADQGPKRRICEAPRRTGAFRAAARCSDSTFERRTGNCACTTRRPGRTCRLPKSSKNGSGKRREPARRRTPALRSWRRGCGRCVKRPHWSRPTRPGRPERGAIGADGFRSIVAQV